MIRATYIALALLLSPALQAAIPFPEVEMVPLPDQEYAFEIDGNEVLRYHGNDRAPKPFIYPLLGPSGKRLTTMSHPEDPDGHRHHRSVWIAHRDVNGHNFWEEKEDNRIVMTRLEAYGHEEKSAWLRGAHEWRSAAGKVIVNEQRTWTVTRLENNEYYLDVTMVLRPGEDGDVTFGQTSFGFLAVRVRPSVSVKFGGGRILNAAGDLNEAGVHWKAAQWVDYMGPVGPDRINGVTLMNHPTNPGSPVSFHVRDEGWMGLCFSYDAPYTLKTGESLTLGYRIYVHGAEVDLDSLTQQGIKFSEK